MTGRRKGKKRHRSPAGAEPHDGGSALLRPIDPERDLLGRAPVRLQVEGDLFLGHGFGHQRVVIPLSSVKALGTYFSPRTRGAPRRGLVVLDAEDRVLLKARGDWPADALGDFARKAGLPSPGYRPGGRRRLRRAKGCRRLRTAPRGSWLVSVFATVALLGCLVFGGAIALLLATQTVPRSFGAVRVLIDIVALLAGTAAGLTASVYLLKAADTAVKWLARWVARRLGHDVPDTPPAPPSLGRSRRRPPGFAGLAVPVLAIFGPIVLTVTIVSGVRDEHLIDRLNRHGVSTSGTVEDRPAVSTGGHGTSITHHVELTFTTRDGRYVTTSDRSIGGVTYTNLAARDVTVVYDPRHPATAAVGRQLRISPWHGGRTTNLVSGSVFTVLLLAYAALRLRGRRTSPRSERRRSPH
ncbi:hypothetical protein GCM10027176_24440 [Actinoallomurus bryophytorum]|uniref:DUF3592 domain-containing protein n=1 Tax=Actinoallomurus bryophytorum TaxID=1490222 RepID=UPI001150350D|nr:DUF3592 domain-containing protein [Actinoallomurus bryophytorum]